MTTYDFVLHNSYSAQLTGGSALCGRERSLNDIQLVTGVIWRVQAGYCLCKDDLKAGLHQTTPSLYLISESLHGVLSAQCLDLLSGSSGCPASKGK